MEVDNLRDVGMEDLTSAGDNIKVCVRVRPFAARETGETCCVQMPSLQQVVCNDGGKISKTWDFDRSYWSHNVNDKHFASQQTLMDELGMELVQNILGGFNSCLFAYGQTGSGKTHSVLGQMSPPENQGLLPRIVNEVFVEGEGMQGRVTCKYKCSYLEIYNEHIRDLLLPMSTTEKSKLEVRHHPQFGVYVPGLTESAVVNHSEVDKLINFGAQARTVAATNMNATSSRSHCIFTLNVEKLEDRGGLKSQLRGLLNFVDLAGSERQSKTGATGARLKEGCMINTSLTNLAIVINKLAENSSKKSKGVPKDFVPFRNSVLTDLLQESLSGNSKTVLIAAISPALSNLDETISTLRFAHTCKHIVTVAKKNEQSSESIISNLKAEIARLKGRRGSLHNDAAEMDLLRQLQESEALREKFEQDCHSALEEAKRHEVLRAQALEDMGLSTQEITHGMGMDVDTPHLVNMSDDPSLRGCLIYYLVAQTGSTVGTDSKCTILIMGLGMKPYMCSFWNADNRTVVIIPLAPTGESLQHDQGQENMAVDAPGRVLVNGNVVSADRELQHYDRVILGYAFCFRLIVPLLAQDRQENIEDEMQDALAEVIPHQSPEFVECHSLMENIADRIGRDRAQVFLQAFGRTLPLVEEGNLLTAELRPDEGFWFQLEVCWDILRFSTDEPELVVRLYQGQRGCGERVVEVFEVDGYYERLDRIRDLHHSKLNGLELEDDESFLDPWASLSFDDVHHMLLVLRQEKDEELHKREEMIAHTASERTTIAHTVSERSEIPEEIDELRSTLAQTRAQLNELQKTMRAQEQGQNKMPSVSIMADEITRLKKTLAERDQQFMEAQHTMDSQKAELQRCRHREARSSQAESPQYVTEMDRLQQIIAERDRQIKDAQTTAEAQQAEIRRLQAGAAVLRGRQSFAPSEAEGAYHQFVPCARATEVQGALPKFGGTGTDALESRLRLAGEESVAAAHLANKLLLSLQQIKEDLRSENQQLTALGTQLGCSSGVQKNPRPM